MTIEFSLTQPRLIVVGSILMEPCTLGCSCPSLSVGVSAVQFPSAAELPGNLPEFLGPQNKHAPKCSIRFDVLAGMKSAVGIIAVKLRRNQTRLKTPVPTPVQRSLPLSPRVRSQRRLQSKSKCVTARTFQISCDASTRPKSELAKTHFSLTDRSRLSQREQIWVFHAARTPSIINQHVLCQPFGTVF
jgi:hypothetical protein